MTFEARKKELGEKVIKLMEEYEIDLIAVNAMTKDGEVHPCVKMVDVSEQNILTNENVNDNQTKEITSGNKEE